MRHPDDTRRPSRWASALATVRQWDGDTAMKWSWLSIGGSVGLVAALVVLETLVRWAGAAIAWGAWLLSLVGS